MKKLLLILLCLPMIGFGQIINDDKAQINPLTGIYNSVNNLEQIEVSKDQFSVVNFEPDCTTDFWTITLDGIIQKWSLINGAISADTVVFDTDSLTSLSYCGTGQPTFYCGAFPNYNIKYYDQATNSWLTLPTNFRPINNGGHNSHQYYMSLLGTSGQSMKELYYSDGINFSLIDVLDSIFYFSVADISVDNLGRAWVFVGYPDTYAGGTITTELRVYDSTGLILSYPISFNSTGAYGSFFLNNNLYFGQAGSHSIYPILIGGGSAQLGTPISFPYLNFGDMASCQDNVTGMTTNNTTKLISVKDILGRETRQTNQLLFYIYDDGTVEKRIIIE